MRIGIVAGEASGDLLGAGLIQALRNRVPDLIVEGIAGPRMVEQGCTALFPTEKLSVMGLVEVLGHYHELRAIRADLTRHFITHPPDVFIGIDAPDFNLGLERKLKQAGIPTVHYVSPSVWAWRRYRVRKIARSVDLMLTLFPFEAAFYASHPKYQVPVKFVGHPLADTIALDEETRMQRAELRKEFGIPVEAEVIALLPGSRVSELKSLARSFIETANWCRERRPGLYFVAPQATPATRRLFEEAVSAYAPDLPVVLLDGRTHEALQACNVALIASGTATLEALLLKRPMVVAYRVAWLTAKLGKPLLHITHFALPNLLAGRELVREFIQDHVTTPSLGQALLGLLDSPEQIEQLRQRFTAIHRSLRKNASERAAEAVLELAGKR
ncbi:MAG TPA: lipid-A-disaccharide synthase [Gammaproteobacteria bacterium]|nr:lipid-A-disaccharide synthase [Gammaproteobacteria bacterium]